MTRFATVAVFFLMVAGSVSWAQRAESVHFDIDVQRDVKPISRFIYGVNQRLEGAYANCQFVRVGGNRWTAYNWTNNASNAGSDWHFQNDSYLGGGATPGGAVTPFIENAKARNAGILLTIPINGYVAADKNGDGDVRLGGENYLQKRFKPEQPKKGAAFAPVPNGNAPAVYQDEYVAWLRAHYPYGFAEEMRPIWFSLDNEPDLWASTHKEVHPAPLTYAELVQKSVEYAKAIKDVTPKAKVFGPVNYGWQGFVNLQNAPDGKGRDFQEFYLKQMEQAESACGKRLLDVLDVHWYPEAQGDNKRILDGGTTAGVAAARVQAPRSLWDATYIETSWITQAVLKKPIALLPRLREKIARNYPGTLLGITEYNYGGGEHISGAIAQADVLGVFGREGVFAAAEWPLAKDEAFIAAGFLMYRNFDGKNGAFGNTSVFAATDNAADSSIYASIDSGNPRRMVLIAINKTDHEITAQMSLRLSAGRAYRVAEVFQLTAEKAEPRQAAALRLASPTGFSYVMPAWSVSALRLTSP